MRDTRRRAERARQPAPQGAGPRQAQASLKGVLGNRAKADQFAANVLPVIRDIERAGVTTLQGIAEALNARGIRTARGRRWYASTVRNLLVRADQVEGVKDAA